MDIAVFKYMCLIPWYMSVQETPQAENKSIYNVEKMGSSDDMQTAYDGLVDTLANEVVNGRESDSFDELMDALAVAGSYSTRNKYLIRVQNSNVIGPFNGYNQWIEDFGRIPEEGSNALWILAPKTVNYCEESDDPAKYCEECEDSCENVKNAVVGFKSVPTFAYSQTVELPEEKKPDDVKDISVISNKDVSTREDREKVANWYSDLVGFYEEMGFEVDEISSIEDWDLSSSARGFFEHGDKGVTIRNFRVGDNNESVDIAERFSTLVHEVAHSLLSHDEVSISNGKKEMEAEAVAYIVCQRFNIETDSGVYISNHLRNEVSDVSDRSEVSEIVEDSIERIGDISGQILEAVRQSKVQ